MTSTQVADRAMVACCKCAATIVIHDVIGHRYPDGHFTLLTLWGFIDPTRTLCTDCEESDPSEEYLTSLYATEPPRDLEFEMKSSWYWLDR